LWKIDIDPPVARFCIKKTGIAADAAVYRILKCIGISRFIKDCILLFRQLHPEIAFLFECIRTIAGNEEEREKKECSEKHEARICEFGDLGIWIFGFSE
jgi:hypothetical protein